MAAWHVFLLLLCCVVLSTYAHPLDDYIAKPDDAYSWYDMGISFSGIGYHARLINVTTIHWLTPADVDRYIWWHVLTVIIPDDKRDAKRAISMLAGGNNGNIPKANDTDVILYVSMALATHSIMVVLNDFPNQPTIFSADPSGKHRGYDSLLGYAMGYALSHPNVSAEWIPLYPMTKSALRCVDAADEFLRKAYGFDIQFWIASGPSKWGWTSWFMAAADKRFKALLPLEFSMLNVVESFRHHYMSLGGWSFALQDYWEQGLMTNLWGDTLKPFWELIDPLMFVNRYTIPVFVLMTTGDEFFLPDCSYYFLKQLLAVTGPKHIHFTPNCEHYMIECLPNVEAAMGAWVDHIYAQKQLPYFTWEFAANGSQIIVTVPKGAPKPGHATVWWAETVSHTARDFRLVILGGKLQKIVWYSRVIKEYKPGTGIYIAQEATPAQGFKAFYVTLHYLSEWPGHFEFSTEASIIPPVYPFPPLHDGETGKLV